MNIFNTNPENSSPDTDLVNIYSGEKILATDIMERMNTGRTAAVRAIQLPPLLSTWQKIFLLLISLMRKALRHTDKGH